MVVPGRHSCAALSAGEVALRTCFSRVHVHPATGVSVLPWLRRATLIPSTVLISGCSEGVLDPHGPIGSAEKLILLNSLGIMLAIVIPTIVATLGVAWWYRASNTRARYRPDFDYSGRVELVTWSIPAMVVLLLGGIAWVGSHDLDPSMPLRSTTPIHVDVVSLDWKWLFIYPDQGIASVNRLVVPAGVAVSFRLTSATVMNSFFVPQLGSQIYTMNGMTTRLNLQADKPGSYQGFSAQFSGDGFSDMGFKLDAVSGAQFASWTAATRGKGAPLDRAAYGQLLKPTERVTPFTYSSVTPGLFESIVSSMSEPLALIAPPRVPSTSNSSAKDI
jgi:cytochrome o ubiquinol oxidase subunit 2